VLATDEVTPPTGLVYQWSLLSGPAGSTVSFSPNASNAAKNTTATFSKSGTYSLRVTATNEALKTATSDVAVLVTPTLNSLVVSPTSVSLNPGQSQIFTVRAYSAAGVEVVPAPAVTWVAAGGTISADGVFTATNAFGGPY